MTVKSSRSRRLQQQDYCGARIMEIVSCYVLRDETIPITVLAFYKSPEPDANFGELRAIRTRYKETTTARYIGDGLTFTEVAGVADALVGEPLRQAKKTARADNRSPSASEKIQ